MSPLATQVTDPAPDSALQRPRVLLISSQLPEASGLLSGLIAEGADVRCASGAGDAAMTALSWGPQLALLFEPADTMAAQRVLHELHVYPALRALRVMLVAPRGSDHAGLSTVDRWIESAPDPADVVAWAAGQLAALPVADPADADVDVLECAFRRALQSLRLVLRPVVSLSSEHRLACQLAPQLIDPAVASFESLAVLAAELGGQVRLQQVLARRLAALLRSQAEGDVFIAIPVDQVDFLLPVLRSADVHPHCARLVVELHEEFGWTLARPQRAGLDALRGLGLRLALAEFGSGGSRLDLWAELRPEFVKLAPVLLQGVALEPRRRAVLAGVMGLAGSLGSLSIACEPFSAADLQVYRELGGLFVQRASEQLDAAS